MIFFPDIKKWNFEKHEYEVYTPGPLWTIILYTEDMDRIINCTNCGIRTTFGACYTSKTLHNSFGMGWPVCEKCHEKELELEEKFRD